MLGLEFLQVRHVLFVLWCLPVLGEVGLVRVFQRLCLGFKWFLFESRKALPILPNKLRNFGECQIPAFQILAHFFTSLVSFHVPTTRCVE